MNDLDIEILDAIKASPGQKAKEIAARVAVDLNTVISVLTVN